jgi:hypothetical protein
MSRTWKLAKARDEWKKKAKDRGSHARALRKELTRIKADRNIKQKKINELEEKLKSQSAQTSINKPDKVTLVYITLSLFLVGRIGFRAISRVLKVLRAHLGISKVPCAQTISNWVVRLSIVKTQCAFEKAGHLMRDVTSGYVWMLDLSIGLGAGKILSVLALNLNHHQQKNGAPTLKDVECVAVSVATKWTGELIAVFLKKVMASVGGAPSAFLKDGGTDLAKAIDILNLEGAEYQNIADISHVIANLFKHVYGKHAMFSTFISACGRVSKNLKQTLLACLAPPKVSVKARFMNLHRLVVWADLLLKHSGRGNAATGSMLAKLRDNLDLLPECKAFISLFLRDALPLLECQKILKQNGLNQITFDACKKLIVDLPITSSIRKGFIDWAKNQLVIVRKLQMGKCGLPVSTDILESLFGVGKRFGVGQTKDADRIASRLPAFCGSFNLDDAKKVVSISVAQQNTAATCGSSLIKLRQDVLPHPGMLETLAQQSHQKNLQLIRTAKVVKETQNMETVNRGNLLIKFRQDIFPHPNVLETPIEKLNQKKFQFIRMDRVINEVQNMGDALW